MARAIQVNSLGFVEWLLRLRPGVAISIGLHAALLLFLAVMLALPPKDPSPPEDRNAIIEMAEPPVPQNPKPAAQPIFRPEPMPTLDRTQTQVPPLPLPPLRSFSREQSTVVTAEEPSQADAQSEPPLIVDPRPISRGGLVYPERAAEHDIAGFVDFSFTIEPDGSVGNAEVIAEERGAMDSPTPPERRFANGGSSQGGSMAKRYPRRREYACLSSRNEDAFYRP